MIPMRNAALSAADQQRLWLFERLLPLVLVIVLPVALAVNHWLRESERRQREELIATLNGLSHHYSVTIDSRDASDPAGVVEALKTITVSQSHHSSPTDPRFVQIRSEGGIVQLCLERDSEVPSEYWVSTPRKGGCGEASFGNPYFGVLRTDRLASYWDRVEK
jgi:hypothetical protein